VASGRGLDTPRHVTPIAATTYLKHQTAESLLLTRTHSFESHRTAMHRSATHRTATKPNPISRLQALRRPCKREIGFGLVAVRCVALRCIAVRCDSKLCVRVRRRDSAVWCFKYVVAAMGVTWRGVSSPLPLATMLERRLPNRQ
jgi:hypothetical protein